MIKWINLISVLLSLLLARSQLQVCTPEIFDKYSVSTERWSFSGYSDGTVLKQVVYASLTNAKYLVGTAEDEPDLLTHVIRKINSDGTVAWTVGFEGLILDKSVIINKEETSIYYLLRRDDLILVEVSTATGSTKKVNKIPSLVCPNERGCELKLDPTKDTGFIALTWQGNSNSICKYSSSVGNIECFTLDLSLTIQSIEVLSTNEVYLTLSGFGASAYLQHLIYDTSSGTFKWNKRINYDGVASTPDFGLSIANNDGSKIYTVSEYIDTIYFHAFSAEDGSTIGSRYKTAMNCNEANGIYFYTHVVYTSMKCDSGRTYILSFNSNMTNHQYYETADGLTIKGLNIDPIHSKLVMTGSHDNQDWTMIKTLTEYPTSHQEISYTSNPLSVDTSYIIVDGSTTITGPEIKEWEDYELYTMPGYSISQNSGDQWISDVAFVGSSFSELEMDQSQEYTLTPLVTCPASEDAEIMYELSDSAPEWVEFDRSTLSLVLTTPKLTEDQIFNFNIEAKVPNDDNIYSTSVVLQIDQCKVDGCDVCLEGDSYTCAPIPEPPVDPITTPVSENVTESEDSEDNNNNRTGTTHADAGDGEREGGCLGMSINPPGACYFVFVLIILIPIALIGGPLIWYFVWKYKKNRQTEHTPTNLQEPQPSNEHHDSQENQYEESPCLEGRAETYREANHKKNASSKYSTNNSESENENRV